MNASRILTMLGRMIFRKLLGRGVNAGIDYTFGPGKPPSEMTPEERRQHQAARKNARRSKRAIRIARRFGRF